MAREVVIDEQRTWLAFFRVRNLAADDLGLSASDSLTDNSGRPVQWCEGLIFAEWGSEAIPETVPSTVFDRLAVELKGLAGTLGSEFWGVKNSPDLKPLDAREFDVDILQKESTALTVQKLHPFRVRSPRREPERTSPPAEASHLIAKSATHNPVDLRLLHSIVRKVAGDVIDEWLAGQSLEEKIDLVVSDILKVKLVKYLTEEQVKTALNSRLVHRAGNRINARRIDLMQHESPHFVESDPQKAI